MFHDEGHGEEHRLGCVFATCSNVLCTLRCTCSFCVVECVALCDVSNFILDDLEGRGPDCSGRRGGSKSSQIWITFGTEV